MYPQPIHLSHLLQVIDLLAGELDFDGADVLSDVSEVLTHSLTAGIHLLGVDPVLRVQILNLPIREHPIKLVVNLVLGPQSSPKSQTLLFPRQLEQVWAFPHDGRTPSGHLKDLLLWRLPCDHIEFLHLRLAQKPARASGKDGRGGSWVQLGRGEAHRSFFGFGFSLRGCSLDRPDRGRSTNPVVGEG